MCDDFSHTVTELKGKGAAFRGEVQDHGYELVVMMAVPGADEIMLYELPIEGAAQGSKAARICSCLRTA